MQIITLSYRPLVTKLSLLLLIIHFTLASYAQTCVHTSLSKKYDFKVNIRRMPKSEDRDSFIVTINIIDKLNKNEVQKIAFGSTDISSNVFSNCKSVRSYTTGVNKSKEAEDNDFGDLIVADLNFDSKEDLALKNDLGGNSGPTYNFYMQDGGGNFVLNSFLTKQMGFFPSQINKISKTLVTMVHANANQLGEHTYKLDSKTNKWKEIKHRLVTVH